MLNFKYDSFYSFRAFWNRISKKGLKDEMAISEQKIEDWRTGFGTIHEQTDDISIVGFEI
jgi:hypothetical protein